MNYVAGGGDPLSPLACNRKVSVFDGRLRYDLTSEFKRTETVKASKGYQGPVMVCAVYFTPVSGYLPNSTTMKYLASIRDAEAWMAPIAGTRVLVPVLAADTGWGWHAGGDAIRHGCKTATSRGEYETAMNAEARTNGRDVVRRWACFVS
jgi:hypothetical protein